MNHNTIIHAVWGNGLYVLTYIKLCFTRKEEYFCWDRNIHWRKRWYLKPGNSWIISKINNKMNNLSPITNDQFHTCSTSGIKSQFFTTPMRRVPRKPLTKMDVYWGLYGIHNFVLLYLSQIFVPCSGILFFNNHYLLVCMFKYCEHLHIISVIEI